MAAVLTVAVIGGNGSVSRPHMSFVCSVDATCCDRIHCFEEVHVVIFVASPIFQTQSQEMIVLQALDRAFTVLMEKGRLASSSVLFPDLLSFVAAYIGGDVESEDLVDTLLDS